MTNLTPELNLKTAVGADDTADYLTLDLADSLTVLDGMFSAGTGHAHNGAHQGSTLGPNAFNDNSLPGAKLVDGSVTTPKLADGAVATAKLADAAVTGPKLGPNLLEALYAGATISVGTNYNVAAGIMFVFCWAPVTVTLPAPASTNRPITVVAMTGTTNVNHTPGVGSPVFGGSINTSTGAIMNGSVSPGDSITYKAETQTNNWRAV